MRTIGGQGSGRREPPQTDSDQPELDRLRSLPRVDSTAHGDEESGVVHHDPERAWSGSTLYTTQMHSRAELIDMDGRVVREWQHTPSSRWERGELLPNGDLIAIGTDPSGRSDWGMPFERLLDVLERPFEERSDRDHYAKPAPPEFTATYETFCGT